MSENNKSMLVIIYKNSISNYKMYHKKPFYLY